MVITKKNVEKECPSLPSVRSLVTVTVGQIPTPYFITAVAIQKDWHKGKVSLKR